MIEVLRRVRDEALRRGVEFADVRSVERVSTTIIRQDGRADKLNQSNGLGIGVRVLKGQAWGFASTSRTGSDDALQCLRAALEMSEASRARIEEPGQVAHLAPIEDQVKSDFRIDPRSVSVSEKMGALERYEKEAIAVGRDYLVNTVVGYSDSYRREIVLNTLGTEVLSESVRTHLHTSMTAGEGDVRQRGTERVGRLAGFELIEETPPADFSIKAANTAVSLLSARKAPAGKFPVVFHPSITGLLTHEAIGHNAEADHVLSGSSIIEGKLGQRIASDAVSIVDDATIPGVWGSYSYDSEGTPSSRRVLVDQGVLTGYMHSLETAAKMGVAPNGSARAQDYYHRPIVRMSNTFIVPGTLSFEALIRDIDLGIYLLGGEWGYVMSEQGQYTCHAGEGYIIRNGQIKEHLRDVSVSGLTLETLMNIDACSSAFEMKMPGTCGKSGQGMPVDNGGPHVRVRELVVGGQTEL